MKKWMKCLVAFGLILMVAACGEQGKEVPISVLPEQEMVPLAISHAEMVAIYAKAKMDWSLDNALRQTLVGLGRSVHQGYGQEKVDLKNVEYTIDVMGRQDDEFNIIIDADMATEVWVIASPRCVKVGLPTNYSVLIRAGEPVEQIALAVLGCWMK